MVGLHCAHALDTLLCQADVVCVSCCVAAVVVLDVVRSWSDLGGPTVLMMLAHLASTQPHWSAVPLKALQVRKTLHLPGDLTRVTQSDVQEYP